MEGSTFRVLLSGLSHAGYSLCVPRVVLDEVVNKYTEEASKAISQIRKLGFSMPRFSGSSRPISSVEEAKEKYKISLLEKLSDVGARLLDYPPTPHEHLVQRALDRRKPFRGTDTGGYRDALIWETILQLAGSEPHGTIAFVSTNSGDFADEHNKERFHPHLVDDLRALGEKRSEVVLFKDLDGFVDTHIKPTLEFLENVRAQLEAGNYPNLNLQTLIQEQLVDLVGWKEFDSRDIGFPTEFESPTITYIDEVHSITNIDVRKLSTNELLITFSADAECEFDVFIFKADFYTLPDDMLPFVWDDDWNKHYMAASASVRVQLTVSLTFDVESNKITSTQIKGITPKEER